MLDNNYHQSPLMTKQRCQTSDGDYHDKISTFDSTACTVSKRILQWRKCQKVY